MGLSGRFYALLNYAWFQLNRMPKNQSQHLEEGRNLSLLSLIEPSIFQPIV